MDSTREVAKSACGLDVHRSEVVAFLITSGTRKRPEVGTRRFRTVLAEHFELRAWLAEAGCEVVGMEAAGPFWRPIYAALEGHVRFDSAFIAGPLLSREKNQLSSASISQDGQGFGGEKDQSLFYLR